MNTEAPTSAPVDGPVRRLLRTLPPTTRGHTVAVIGEFVGTISFLFFAFAGTQYVSSNQQLALPLPPSSMQDASRGSLHASRLRLTN